MNTNIFSTLLTKGKNVAEGLKKISGVVKGNDVLVNIEQLEKAVPKMDVETRLSVAKSLDLDILFNDKKYDLLLRLGQIEEFVNRGLANEVIARFTTFRKELGKNIYVRAISCITEQMLDAYLKKVDNNLDFFIIHPLGLQVLAANEYSGFIAANEKEFRAIAENFPDEFRGATLDARRKYISTLKRYLD